MQIYNPKIILSLFLIFIISENAFTNSSTEGNYSPIITNVKGSVTIIYGNDNKKKLRVTYYRLSGISADFLAKGLLSKKWEKVLGGQQEIINNNVLANTRKILSLFSMESFGSIMYDSENPTSVEKFEDNTMLYKYLNFVDNKPNNDKDLKFYLGGESGYSIIYPDLKAMDIIKNKLYWPENYKLFHACSPYQKGESDPIIWKYVTSGDLDNYYKNVSKYIHYIYENDTEISIRGSRSPYDTIKHNKEVIFPLKNITKNGLPKDFLIVYGERGIHGGWELEIYPRNIEVEVAVLESISNSPIEVGALQYKKVRLNKLSSYAEVTNVLKKSETKEINIHTTGILTAGEKLVIPLRNSFRQGYKFERCPIPNYNTEKVKFMSGGSSNDIDYLFRFV